MQFVIESLGGQLLREEMEYGTSGHVTKRQDRFIVTCRRGESEERMRFTAAHELGHLFLHMGYIVDPTRWERLPDAHVNHRNFHRGIAEQEHEADEFAGTFLMPSEEFRNAVDQHMREDGSVSLELLSRQFGVSKQAAIVRGRWLGIFQW